MKTYLISVINAVTLIVFGTWGYSVSENPSFTAFIPVVMGVLILFFVKGVKKEADTAMIIASVLTLAVLAGLIKPFIGALDRCDSGSIGRVVFMMITTVISLVMLVKNLILKKK